MQCCVAGWCHRPSNNETSSIHLNHNTDHTAQPGHPILPQGHHNVCKQTSTWSARAQPGPTPPPLGCCRPRSAAAIFFCKLGSCQVNTYLHGLPDNNNMLMNKNNNSNTTTTRTACMTNRNPLNKEMTEKVYLHYKLHGILGTSFCCWADNDMSCILSTLCLDFDFPQYYLC